MKSSAYKKGLFYFQKLSITILRKSVTKGNPRNIFYRNCKIFDQNKFQDQFCYKLSSIKINFMRFF